MENSGLAASEKFFVIYWIFYIKFHLNFSVVLFRCLKVLFIPLWGDIDAYSFNPDQLHDAAHTFLTAGFPNFVQTVVAQYREYYGQYYRLSSLSGEAGSALKRVGRQILTWPDSYKTKKELGDSSSNSLFYLVAPAGLEPATKRLWVACSNHWAKGPWRRIIK